MPSSLVLELESSGQVSGFPFKFYEVQFLSPLKWIQSSISPSVATRIQWSVAAGRMHGSEHIREMCEVPLPYPQQRCRLGVGILSMSLSFLNVIPSHDIFAKAGRSQIIYPPSTKVCNNLHHVPDIQPLKPTCWNEFCDTEVSLWENSAMAIKIYLSF